MGKIWNKRYIKISDWTSMKLGEEQEKSDVNDRRINLLQNRETLKWLLTIDAYSVFRKMRKIKKWRV